jgi:hypothetical protein
MSIVVRYQPNNVNKQQYDAVRKQLQDDGNWPPPGCEMHVCFGSEDNIRVSEIWESREQFQSFGQTLQPLLEQNSIQLAGEPEVYDAMEFDTF